MAKTWELTWGNGNMHLGLKLVTERAHVISICHVTFELEKNNYDIYSFLPKLVYGQQEI